MDLEHALLGVGLLIVACKLLEGVCRRLGLNAIVAYAAAGVLLGPVTGLVDPESGIDLVLGLGIFLFFFLIGIEEMDIKGFLSAVRSRIFLVSTLSVAIALLAALAVTTDALVDLDLGLTFTDALGLSAVLALSSLGIVAKALVDEGRIAEPVGVRMFTAVLIAELIALFTVGFVISEKVHIQGEGLFEGALSVALSVLRIAAFTVATWLVANKALPPVIVLLHRVLQTPQLSFGVLLGCLFLVVVGAEQAGLHGSLGALLFGAALSFLPQQVRRDMMPGMRGAADGFFVPLFFASVGMQFSLAFLDLPPLTILALVLAPFAGKLVGSFLSAYLARIEAPLAVGTGLMGKGVAEVALLLLLFQADHINEGVFSLLVLVMLVYILVSPMAIGAALRRVRPAEAAVPLGQVPPSQLHFALQDVRVGDILDRSRTHPGAGLTVRKFVENWIVAERHDYVVVDGAALAGIVSLSMLRFLPRHTWDTVTLAEALRQNTAATTPDELLEDALQRMTEASLSALPVLNADGSFVGSISSSEILDMLVLSARGH